MKRYAATMNAIQLIGWMMVLVGALVQYANCPRQLLLLALVVQLLNVYDLLLIINRQRTSPKLAWILQNGARVLFLALLVLAKKYEIEFKLFYAVDAASVLLAVWSIAEICRFLFYIFKTPLSTFLRYNAFLICYPAGFAIELTWIYYLYTGLLFTFAKIALVLLAIAYLFGFPYLFLYLYRSRTKKLYNE